MNAPNFSKYKSKTGYVWHDYCIGADGGFDVGAGVLRRGLAVG